MNLFIQQFILLVLLLSTLRLCFFHNINFLKLFFLICNEKSRIIRVSCCPLLVQITLSNFSRIKFIYIVDVLKIQHSLYPGQSKNIHRHNKTSDGCVTFFLLLHFVHSLSRSCQRIHKQTR